MNVDEVFDDIDNEAMDDDEDVDNNDDEAMDDDEDHQPPWWKPFVQRIVDHDKQFQTTHTRESYKQLWVEFVAPHIKEAQEQYGAKKTTFLHYLCSKVTNPMRLNYVTDVFDMNVTNHRECWQLKETTPNSDDELERAQVALSRGIIEVHRFNQEEVLDVEDERQLRDLRDDVTSKTGKTPGMYAYGNGHFIKWHRTLVDMINNYDFPDSDAPYEYDPALVGNRDYSSVDEDRHIQNLLNIWNCHFPGTAIAVNEGDVHRTRKAFTNALENYEQDGESNNIPNTTLLHYVCRFVDAKKLTFFMMVLNRHFNDQFVWRHTPFSAKKDMWSARDAVDYTPVMYLFTRNFDNNSVPLSKLPDCFVPSPFNFGIVIRRDNDTLDTFPKWFVEAKQGDVTIEEMTKIVESKSYSENVSHGELDNNYLRTYTGHDNKTFKMHLCEIDFGSSAIIEMVDKEHPFSDEECFHLLRQTWWIEGQGEPTNFPDSKDVPEWIKLLLNSGSLAGHLEELFAALRAFGPDIYNERVSTTTIIARILALPPNNEPLQTAVVNLHGSSRNVYADVIRMQDKEDISLFGLWFRCISGAAATPSLNLCRMMIATCSVQISTLENVIELIKEDPNFNENHFFNASFLNHEGSRTNLLLSHVKKASDFHHVTGTVGQPMGLRETDIEWMQQSHASVTEILLQHEADISYRHGNVSILTAMYHECAKGLERRIPYSLNDSLVVMLSHIDRTRSTPQWESGIINAYHLQNDSESPLYQTIKGAMCDRFIHHQMLHRQTWFNFSDDDVDLEDCTVGTYYVSGNKEGYGYKLVLRMEPEHQGMSSTRYFPIISSGNGWQLDLERPDYKTFDTIILLVEYYQKNEVSGVELETIYQPPSSEYPYTTHAWKDVLTKLIAIQTLDVNRRFRDDRDQTALIMLCDKIAGQTWKNITEEPSARRQTRYTKAEETGIVKDLVVTALDFGNLVETLIAHKNHNGEDDVNLNVVCTIGLDAVPYSAMWLAFKRKSVSAFRVLARHDADTLGLYDSDVNILHNLLAASEKEQLLRVTQLTQWGDNRSWSLTPKPIRRIPGFVPDEPEELYAPEEDVLEALVILCEYHRYVLNAILEKCTAPPMAVDRSHAGSAVITAADEEGNLEEQIVAANEELKDLEENEALNTLVVSRAYRTAQSEKVELKLKYFQQKQNIAAIEERINECTQVQNDCQQLPKDSTEIKRLTTIYAENAGDATLLSVLGLQEQEDGSYINSDVVTAEAATKNIVIATFKKAMNEHNFASLSDAEVDDCIMTTPDLMDLAKEYKELRKNVRKQQKLVHDLQNPRRSARSSRSVNPRDAKSREDETAELAALEQSLRDFPEYEFNFDLNNLIETTNDALEETYSTDKEQFEADIKKYERGFELAQELVEKKINYMEALDFHKIRLNRQLNEAKVGLKALQRTVFHTNTMKSQLEANFNSVDCGTAVVTMLHRYMVNSTGKRIFQRQLMRLEDADRITIVVNLPISKQKFELRIIQYSEIEDLKKEIAKVTQIATRDQKLLYNGTELKSAPQEQRKRYLVDIFNIPKANEEFFHPPEVYLGLQTDEHLLSPDKLRIELWNAYKEAQLERNLEVQEELSERVRHDPILHELEASEQASDDERRAFAIDRLNKGTTMLPKGGYLTRMRQTLRNTELAARAKLYAIYMFNLKSKIDTAIHSRWKRAVEDMKKDIFDRVMESPDDVEAEYAAVEKEYEKEYAEAVGEDKKKIAAKAEDLAKLRTLFTLLKALRHDDFDQWIDGGAESAPIEEYVESALKHFYERQKKDHWLGGAALVQASSVVYNNNNAYHYRYKPDEAAIKIKMKAANKTLRVMKTLTNAAHDLRAVQTLGEIGATATVLKEHKEAQERIIAFMMKRFESNPIRFIATIKRIKPDDQRDEEDTADADEPDGMTDNDDLITKTAAALERLQEEREATLSVQAALKAHEKQVRTFQKRQVQLKPTDNRLDTILPVHTRTLHAPQFRQIMRHYKDEVIDNEENSCNTMSHAIQYFFETALLYEYPTSDEGPDMFFAPFGEPTLQSDMRSEMIRSVSRRPILPASITNDGYDLVRTVRGLELKTMNNMFEFLSRFAPKLYHEILQERIALPIEITKTEEALMRAESSNGVDVKAAKKKLLRLRETLRMIEPLDDASEEITNEEFAARVRRRMKSGRVADPEPSDAFKLFLGTQTLEVEKTDLNATVTVTEDNPNYMFLSSSEDKENVRRHLINLGILTESAILDTTEKIHNTYSITYLCINPGQPNLARSQRSRYSIHPGTNVRSWRRSSQPASDNQRNHRRFETLEDLLRGQGMPQVGATNSRGHGGGSILRPAAAGGAGRSSNPRFAASREVPVGEGLERVNAHGGGSILRPGAAGGARQSTDRGQFDIMDDDYDELERVGAHGGGSILRPAAAGGARRSSNPRSAASREVPVGEGLERVGAHGGGSILRPAAAGRARQSTDRGQFDIMDDDYDELGSVDELGRGSILRPAAAGGARQSTDRGQFDIMDQENAGMANTPPPQMETDEHPTSDDSSDDIYNANTRDLQQWQLRDLTRMVDEARTAVRNKEAEDDRMDDDAYSRDLDELRQNLTRLENQLTLFQQTLNETPEDNTPVVNPNDAMDDDAGMASSDDESGDFDQDFNYEPDQDNDQENDQENEMNVEASFLDKTIVRSLIAVF